MLIYPPISAAGWSSMSAVAVAHRRQRDCLMPQARGRCRTRAGRSLQDPQERERGSGQIGSSLCRNRPVSFRFGSGPVFTPWVWSKERVERGKSETGFNSNAQNSRSTVRDGRRRRWQRGKWKRFRGSYQCSITLKPMLLPSPSSSLAWSAMPFSSGSSSGLRPSLPNFLQFFQLRIFTTIRIVFPSL